VGTQVSSISAGSIRSPAQLHLRVRPPDELERVVAAEPDEVACPVDAGAARGANGSGRKPAAVFPPAR